MVIATSGYGDSINFNRIISSTTSPSYFVDTDESKTFRDTSSGNKQLSGLFIIDRDNLVSSISRADSTTDIATVNFALLSIIYKKCLPARDWGLSSVFVSASVFYTVSYYWRFY